MNLQNCVLSKSFFTSWSPLPWIVNNVNNNKKNNWVIQLMTTGFFPSHRLWAAFWCLRRAVLCLLRLGPRQCWVPRLAPVPWILEGEEMFPLNIYRPSTLRNFLLQSQNWGQDGVTPTLHPHRTCLAALFVLGKKVISDRKLKLYIRSEREKKNIWTLKNKLNRGDVQRKLSKENLFHLENSTENRIEHQSEGREEREELASWQVSYNIVCSFPISSREACCSNRQRGTRPVGSSPLDIWLSIWFRKDGNPASLAEMPSWILKSSVHLSFQ